MKQFSKIIALALCIVMLCLTLCSCQYLDDAKANTAVYTDDSKEEFLFRDHLYKRIDISDKLAFIMSSVQGGSHVTASDVPVLLSASYGDAMFYDKKDGESPTVIRVQKREVVYDSRITAALADDLDGFIPEYESEVSDDSLMTLSDALLLNYVREDQYDRVQKAVEEAAIDHYYVLVYQYSEPGVPWEGGQYIPQMLDDAVTEVINRTVSGNSVVSWKDVPDSTWYSIYIGTCDKEFLLTDNSGFLSLLTNGNDYYLYYSNNVDRLYKVSDDDFNVIRKVYSMCKDSMEYADIEYYRENADKLGRIYDGNDYIIEP